MKLDNRLSLAVSKAKDTVTGSAAASMHLYFATIDILGQPEPERNEKKVPNHRT
jgi:hypothetical protein